MSGPNDPGRAPPAPRRSAGAGPGYTPGLTQGFTLIELILALSLLTVVLTLLYTSFFQVAESSKKLSNMLMERQEMRLIMKMIGDDLQGAQYFGNFAELEGITSGIIADTDFLLGGEFTVIHFHAAIPSRFFRQISIEFDPRMHEVAYWVEQSPEDPELLLLMRREDYYLDEDMEEGGVSSLIAENITEFKVEFLPYAKRDADEGLGWEEEWESARRGKGDRMPAALRLTLARKGPGGAGMQEILEINLQSSLRVGG